MQCYEKAQRDDGRERVRERAGRKESVRVATTEPDLRSEEDPELREMGQDMMVRQVRDARCRDCVARRVLRVSLPLLSSARNRC